MSASYRRSIQVMLAAVLLAAVAGWLAPSFFRADRYRRRLRESLERELGRPVSFGEMSVRLLPRPGFSIQNVVVAEDAAFGAEPFARVDRLESVLGWRSLWHSRLDIDRLYLERPSFNLVRDGRGEWNVRTLFRSGGVARPSASGDEPAGSSSLSIEMEEARIDFKFERDKKPFAVSNLSARLVLDRARHRVSFRLQGEPIRTDLSLPSPGRLELAGEWTPGPDLDGPLDATLEIPGAMVYDWIPLLTGINPEIYGVLEGKVRLSGSIRSIKFDGQSEVSQLRRWESLPPSDTLPATIYFRGQFDRPAGRVSIESLDASFADSHLHASGAVNQVLSTPNLDLVVAVEHSHLEDFLALGRRFTVQSESFGASGRVDGLLTIQGPWAERRYGGFISVRGGRLSTSAGDFPVSELALRIDGKGARLAPFKLTLAPEVELVAEGRLEPELPATPETRSEISKLKAVPAAGSRYDLALSVKAVPLDNLVRFGRALGLGAMKDLDAQGVATATFRLIGAAWPPARPQFTGQAELRGARLFLPGLTEPLSFPHAHVEVDGDKIIADPVVAVIGTSVFSGRLEHQGDRKQAWSFEARTPNLSVEQGALWFDVLGHRPPLRLIDRIPGLRSLVAQRTAASSLFGGLNARGRFTASNVTYHALNLKDFHASMVISGRVIRLTVSSFRAGGGRGRGNAVVDLTASPARVVVDARLNGAAFQALGPRLPPVLRKARGTYSAVGHFETRGLTRGELSSNLVGQATVRLKNASFGDFDPLAALARAGGEGILENVRGESVLKSATVSLRVRNRQIVLGKAPLELAGAKLILSGTYQFDGTTDLDVRSDLTRVTRRWLEPQGDETRLPRTTVIHLTGPLDKLSAAPEEQISRVSP